MQTQEHTSRSRGETIEPKATAELVMRDGVTRAARALGVSTTTLHKARNANEVSKVVEVAAAGLLGYNAAEPRSFSPRAIARQVPNLNPQLDTTLYLIEVPADRAEIVEQFAEKLGAHVLKA